MKTLFLTLLVAVGLFSTTARLESDETPRDPIAWIVDDTDNETIYNSMIRTLEISALRGKYRIAKKEEFSNVQDLDRFYLVSTSSGVDLTIYSVVKCLLFTYQPSSGSISYYKIYSGNWYGATYNPSTDDLKDKGFQIAQTIVEHYLQ